MRGIPMEQTCNIPRWGARASKRGKWLRSGATCWSQIFNSFHTIPLPCSSARSPLMLLLPAHAVTDRTTEMWVAPPSSSPTEPCHARPMAPPNSPPILPQPASLACSSLTRPPLLVSVTVTVAGNGQLFLPPDPVTAVSPSVTVVSPTLIHTPPHTHTRTTETTSRKEKGRFTLQIVQTICSLNPPHFSPFFPHFPSPHASLAHFHLIPPA